jgi:hypothetical protein
MEAGTWTYAASANALYVLIAAASAWAAISLPAVEDMDAG